MYHFMLITPFLFTFLFSQWLYAASSTNKFFEFPKGMEKLKVNIVSDLHNKAECIKRVGKDEVFSQACSEGSNRQVWWIKEKNNPETYQIRATFTGKCLQTEGGGGQSEEGLAIGLQKCTLTENLGWSIESFEKSYIFRNVENGLCISAVKDSSELIQKKCGTSPEFTFRITLWRDPMRALSPEARKRQGLILPPSLVELPQDLDQYQSFHDLAFNSSWFYLYRNNLAFSGSEKIIKFANANYLEYVPMIYSRKLLKQDGSSCFLWYPEKAGKINCTALEIEEEFSQQSAKLAKPIRFVMFANEPWKQGSWAKLNPQSLAEQYAFFFNDIFAHSELRGVTPTMENIQSAAEFYHHCAVLDDKVDFHCDPNLINRISVHEYSCHQSTWKNYGSNYVNKLKNLLLTLEETTPTNFGTKGGWDLFTSGVSLWITETNCNWNWPAETRPISNIDACEMTSGIKTNYSSLKELRSGDYIEKYAWWTSYYPTPEVNETPNSLYHRVLNSRLTNDDGDLEYTGRALANYLNACQVL